MFPFCSGLPSFSPLLLGRAMGVARCQQFVMRECSLFCGLTQLSFLLRLLSRVLWGQGKGTVANAGNVDSYRSAARTMVTQPQPHINTPSRSLSCFFSSFSFVTLCIEYTRVSMQIGSLWFGDIWFEE